jgi:hypothetical protein
MDFRLASTCTVAHKVLLLNLEIESEVSCLKENEINSVDNLPQSLIDKMKMVDALLLTIGCIPAYRGLFDKLAPHCINFNDD